ncbi:DUF2218 domain-containing protein [Microvirga terricola]|uniref:DUF2218 domain-containing protein n=1 Tax=Microvirga terricola TaxID=2719797 RepID=A0ABX0V5F7_9HYPH|nr:DUF2218 domain-containing protein [Microvirga terricola]NIX75068.1 DUF2218 domain-containing protein [Microvirga terricola]
MAPLRAEANIDTIAPDRYLVQLCKRFAPNDPATYSNHQGRAEFEFGNCTLLAAGRSLTLVAEAEDEASLAQVQRLVSTYLEQSMWRERPTITWIRRG